MIHFQNIHKTYRHKKSTYTALQAINFKVAKGEIVGIIGQSGAGKSTLIRIANHLELPTSGDVYINEQSLKNLNPKALSSIRQSIGMIFQHFNLLDSRTVTENVALPLELIGTSKTDIHSKVDELLKLVGLGQKKDHYPEALSGGEKQRVAIARALATEPTILLCDEATSALDPETTATILALLKKINQKMGITILLITHEMSVIKAICERVGVLEQGKLVEESQVIDLFANPLSAAGKRLTTADMHLGLPESISANLKDTQAKNTYPLVRFVFRGKAVGEPLLSRVFDAHHIQANILQANIETFGKEALGITVCQLVGESANIDKALKEIENQPVEMEVLGYVNAHVL